MNANEMIDLRNRLPFVPFTIHLRDGAAVRVEQPYVLATGRNSPECVIYESADRIRFVAYRDIAEITTAPENGSSRQGS